jgi:hypothetical protein
VIGRIETLLRRMRRIMSRSEWLATLLRLPRTVAPATAPGLVMIQIDGLSHIQLNCALKQGKMPFLQRLIKREHYQLHRQYAGVPSTTAAYQGELFYRVKGVVPGYSFRDNVSRRVVRMIEPTAAASVELRLEETGDEPLLKGGSSYVSNYTGGADEAHFCPSSLGWGPALRSANPLLVGLLLLSNAYSFVRIGVLLVLEALLSIVDCARGLFGGEDFIKELKFVPTRVAICILLRELATIGVKIDIARGLPIIYVNFIGYDEQAHRRGPSSLFAHWTLKGIDDAIARIWRASQRSAHRNYDLWVYSDHGQEEVQPYHTLHGRSIEEAVSAVFTEAGISAEATVTAPGPVAFVYCDSKLEAPAHNALARALVTTAGVPLVLTTDGPGCVKAWTETGVFALPRQNAEILGADHPFLEEATGELIELCHHPDAGDFILCGWRTGETPCSFAIENGAHGGAGPEETSARLPACRRPASCRISLSWSRRTRIRCAAKTHYHTGCPACHDLQRAQLHRYGR